VSASFGVNVPSTLTTAANGTVDLVIAPIPGEGGELVGGEGTSVIFVSDAGVGTPFVTIIVTWVLPTITVANANLAAQIGTAVTTTVTVTDPTAGTGIEGLPFDIDVSNSDVLAPVAVSVAGGNQTGTVASGLPGIFNLGADVPVTAEQGDSCTVIITIPGIPSAELSAVCTVYVPRMI
jgi:hypothetical protein